MVDHARCLISLSNNHPSSSMKFEADDAALDQDEDDNGKQSSEDAGVVSMKERD